MSSIFDNDKLLADLIKSAVDHEVKFNKHGQLAADPTVNVEFKNYLTLTQKLAEQLRSKYFPKPSDAPTVSTATGKDAPMGVPDLASLGNFLDFIVNNQITVDNKRVAYGAGEKNPDPLQYLPVTAEQIKFMVETVTQQGDRTQFQADYYVSIDLLKKYITSILKETSTKDEETQRFTKAMLSARLQDINRVFRTKLTTDYKEPVKPIDDNAEVDRFPKVVESFTNMAQAGDTPLLYKDIKSLESLNSWLGSKGIGHKTKDQKLVTIRDQDFDLCGIINYMYGRANLLYRRRTAESGPIMQTYMKQMEAIAGQADCKLTAPGGQSQPSGQQQGDGSGQVNPVALQQLLTLRPFNSEFINFHEIKIFVDSFAPVRNTKEAINAAQQIDSSIEKAKGMMNQPSDTIMLGMLVESATLEPLKALSRQPMPFMNLLFTIVQNAGAMYQEFVGIVKNVLPRVDSNSIAAQVYSGGPWSNNMADINQFRRRLMQEARNQ
jgi:hypothetical protein